MNVLQRKRRGLGNSTAGFCNPRMQGGIWNTCSELRVCQVETWPAVQKWTVSYLQKVFKGKNIVAGNYEMPFDTYVHYMRGNRDELPLYLFDKHFVQKAPELANDFQAGFTPPSDFRAAGLKFCMTFSVGLHIFCYL